MTNESKSPWWGWLIVLFLMPVAYVLSCFLVALVADRLDLGPPNFLRSFYAPLRWAADEWDWFLAILKWIAKGLGLD